MSAVTDAGHGDRGYRHAMWRYLSQLGEAPAATGILAALIYATSAGTVAGIFVWMPSNSGGASSPICSVTASPQSPP